MGAVRKIVISLTVLLVAISYWLYYPVPDGYSASTTNQLRIVFAAFKVFDVVSDIGEFLGFGSNVDIYRALFASVLELSSADTLDPSVTTLFIGGATCYLTYGNPEFQNAGLRLPGSSVSYISDKLYSFQTKDVTFDGISVRIYTPVGEKKLRPGFVFIHGGGWVLGSINKKIPGPETIMFWYTMSMIYWEVDDQLWKLLMEVALGWGKGGNIYRLAPEWIFPAGHDDCVTATKYFLKHAHEYNVDPKRIAVGGDSAGGNLAATVALRLRDEAFEPKLAMQVLIYPSLQAVDFQLPSMKQNAYGPLLTQRKTTFYKCMYLDGNDSLADVYQNNGHVAPKFMKEMSETYLNVDQLPERYLKGYERPTSYTGSAEIWELVRGQILNPYFSPLTAADLTRLPMTYVFTCEHDLLRDEGLLYAHRLKEAGNRVTSVTSEIGIHGVISFALNFPEARVMLDEIVAYIVSNL